MCGKGKFFTEFCKAMFVSKHLCLVHNAIRGGHPNLTGTRIWWGVGGESPFWYDTMRKLISTRTDFGLPVLFERTFYPMHNAILRKGQLNRCEYICGGGVVNRIRIPRVASHAYLGVGEGYIYGVVVMMRWG